MGKTTEMRVGFVRIKLVVENKWRASWWDAVTQRHIRQMLPVTRLADAKAEAEAINQGLLQGHGFRGRMRGGADHGVDLSIRDAVLGAIRNNDANPDTRRHYLDQFNRFADYLSPAAKPCA